MNDTKTNAYDTDSQHLYNYFIQIPQSYIFVHLTVQLSSERRPYSCMDFLNFTVLLSSRWLLIKLLK